MTPRIDKIIKKAECIKSYLENNNKDAGNINGLIESLVSYRENVGDIEEEKLFTFSMSCNKWHDYIKYDDFPIYTCAEPFWEHDWQWDVPNLVGIKAIEFTRYIASRVLKRGASSRHLMSLPPIYLNEHIANAVFDVQSFKANDVLLTTELINAGLRPMKTNINFVCDFD